MVLYFECCVSRIFCNDVEKTLIFVHQLSKMDILIGLLTSCIAHMHYRYVNSVRFVPVLELSSLIIFCEAFSN